MCALLCRISYIFVVMVTLFYWFKLYAAVGDLLTCSIHLNIASDDKTFMFALSLITLCDWQLLMVLWPSPGAPAHLPTNGKLQIWWKVLKKVLQGYSSALSSSPTYTIESLQCQHNEAEISHDSNYVVERMCQTWYFLVTCAFTFISPQAC